VLIASQIVRDELGFDFPQEVDFKSIYASCSVWCDEIRTPAQARRKAAMAAQAALAQSGVAVLIVPADISSAPDSDPAPFAVHRNRPVTIPSVDELARVALLINQGKKVAIYGGSGCEQARDAVVALAGRIKAPVAHTSRATDFLAHDNSFNVGMTGVFGGTAGYRSLMECDTLVLLGCDFAWRQFYPDKARIVQIDIDPTHLGRRHPVELGVVGDIGPTLEALLAHITPREDRAFLDDCLGEAKADAHRQEARAIVGKSGAIHPQYLTTLISDHAQADAIYTADGGSPMVWCLRHIRATGLNRRVLSLTHGTMANAMPQALGAQAAYPGRQVIALCGDGGLAMLLGDLITTIQEDLPIKVCVFNNSSLGFVELEQKVEGLLDAYTDLKNPDFAEVARAVGMAGWRVEQPEALDDAVRRWLAEPGPALLDVVTDRFELVMPPKVTAQQVFGTALYSAKAILSGRSEDVGKLIGHALAP
jgi:pyruvate dehydrogenase (quinone)